MSFLLNCFQPVSQLLPGKTSPCMTHHTEHVIIFLMHTHRKLLLSARGFPLQHSMTCIRTSLTENYKEKPCISVCLCGFLCFCVGNVRAANCLSRHHVNGTVLVFLHATVWWGVTHPDGDPEDDWQVGDSPCNKKKKKNTGKKAKASDMHLHVPSINPY